MLIFGIISAFIGYLIISADINLFHDFGIVLVGIIIQAFPFLMLGTVVSSVIRVFVPDTAIIKFFPQKGVLSIFSSVMIGIFLPLCDCSVIPVAARLKKKGVPVHAVISFIMSAPIVNPIVIIATMYAFGFSWEIAFWRVAVGVLIAVVSGLIIRVFYKENSQILSDDFEKESETTCCCCCGHEHNKGYEHAHEHECEHEQDASLGMKSKFINALIHTGDEFFSVSKLFIIGDAISSAIQTFFPSDILMSFTDGIIPSVFTMMTVAFIMSVCSTSDSFIARSFLNTMSIHGVFAFMVFGPAMDLKNAIMMTGFFKKKFIMDFLAVIFITALVILSIAGSILF